MRDFSAHSVSEAIELGAKNQTAAGRYFPMRNMDAESGAPQLINPRPIGRVLALDSRGD